MTPALRRSQIVPLIDHHQHILGPMLLEDPPPELPEVKLPPELDRVLREREKLSGGTSLGDLYTDDAQVLDISGAEDHWTRDRHEIGSLLRAYTNDTWYFPNAYAIDGSTAYISGVTRTGESKEADLNFTLGLRKDPSGQWRIASEQASVKPPMTHTRPITAADLIANLDDAGIERAVVLSTAYWAASGLTAQPRPDEQAVVRAANDWVIDQVARYPDRLVAFCSVNPLSDYAIDEVRRCSKLPGVKGIKLHFGNSNVDLKNPRHLEKIRRFFRAANELRMPIVVHLWTIDTSYGAEHARIFLEKVLPESPDIVVQIAHLGGGGRYVYDDVLGVFADAMAARDPRMKNVYFDLTTVVDESVSTQMLDRLAGRLRQIGLDRILYGSDMTDIHHPAPIVAWATFRRRIPLTDDEVRRIAGNVAPYMR